MTTAILPAVNIQAGSGQNPLATGAWASLEQAQFIVVYNTTATILSIQGAFGSKTIWPNTADVISTEGQGVTFIPQFPPSVALGTYLGACPSTLYDNAEDEPTGFPLQLPTFPTSGSATIVSALQLTPSAGAATIAVQPPIGTTTLVVQNQSQGSPVNSETVTITGVQTGIVYVSSATIQAGASLSVAVGGGDLAYTVALTPTFRGGIITNSIYASTSPIIPDVITTVPNPAAATDWSYVVPVPCTLKAITATLANTGVTCFPFLTIANAVMNLPMSVGMIDANTQFVGFNGAPLELQTSYGGEGRALFPIPEIPLQQGATIESITVSIAAGCQWEDIVLFFDVG